jgi:hypothetical protein
VRRGVVDPKIRVVFSPSFCFVGRCVLLRLFTFAVRGGDVVEAGKGSVLFWRLNVNLDKFADVDYDIPTNGPSCCAVSPGLDRRGKVVLGAK